MRFTMTHRGLVAGLLALVALGACDHDYTDQCNCSSTEVCAVNAGMCEDESFKGVACCPMPQACVDAGAQACNSAACLSAIPSCGGYNNAFTGSCSIKANGSLAFETCD